MKRERASSFTYPVVVNTLLHATTDPAAIISPSVDRGTRSLLVSCKPPCSWRAVQKHTFHSSFVWLTPCLSLFFCLPFALPMSSSGLGYKRSRDYPSHDDSMPLARPSGSSRHRAVALASDGEAAAMVGGGAGGLPYEDVETEASSPRPKKVKSWRDEFLQPDSTSTTSRRSNGERKDRSRDRERDASRDRERSKYHRSSHDDRYKEDRHRSSHHKDSRRVSSRERDDRHRKDRDRRRSRERERNDADQNGQAKSG